MECYTHMMSELVAVAKIPGNHWRYQLMAYALLGIFIKEEVVLPDVITLLVQGLVNELEPLRRVCIMGCQRIFALHRRSFPKTYQETNTRDPTVIAAALDALHSSQSDKGLIPLTAEQWAEAKIIDHNYSGWSGEALVYRTYGKPEKGQKRAKTELVGGYIPTDTLKSLEVFIRKELTKIVTTLEQNHPTLSKNTETSARNSNQGAGHVIASHSYYEASLIWPFTRLPQHSSAFDPTHVSFVRGLVCAFPSLVTEKPLLLQLDRLCKERNEEDHQCTAAEIVSGIVRGSKHWDFSEQLQLQESLLPIIKDALAVCQPVCLEHWKDCLRFMWSNNDPRRCFWLFNPLCEMAFTQTQDEKEEDGPATVAKHLKFVQASLTEGTWRSKGASKLVLSKLMTGNWLSHPYKQVRNAVAGVLYFVNRNLYERDKPNEALEHFLSVVDAKLNSFKYVKDEIVSTIEDNKEEHDKQLKREQHYIETVVTWVWCVVGGDVVFSIPAFSKLVAHVIKAQHHTESACAEVAKASAQYLAWANGLTATQATEIIKAVKLVAVSKHFDVRASAYKFLWVFIPRYALLLKDATVTGLYTLCEEGLVDNRVEVRVKAYETYSSLLACREQKESKRERSVKRLMKLARTPIKKEDSNTIAKRHGGVLGLSGYVVTHPYDVPDYVPAIVAFLAGNIKDMPPIKAGLRSLFASFKSTHQDEWQTFKEKFTEEQLDALAGVEIAPSYFA